MTAAGFLAEACAVDRRIYLLFPAGLRLTLYSQQVRATLLVEALRQQAWTNNLNSIAVVGGGASGMTAAAALKIGGFRTQNITLFESNDRLVPLQSGSHKMLAPHIIDWPTEGAANEAADLPILNWKSDVAENVATEIQKQFDRFSIDVRTGHTVKTIKVNGNSVELVVEHDAAETTARFDLVVVAVGFGLETKPAGITSETPSYWRIHPEQQPALGQIPERSILVSGLGDGGLIDFVLFACPGLSHKQLCDTLLSSPDALALHSEIDRIEDELWANPAPTMDVAARYAALPIEQLARDLILPNLVSKTQFSLLTSNEQLFDRTTAPLNRLAAALVIKAMELDDKQTSVTPLVKAEHCKDEGGHTVYMHFGKKHLTKFDIVVVRHGDASKTAWDFDNAEISALVEKHRAGRRAIAERPVTPQLDVKTTANISARAFAACDTRIRITQAGRTAEWHSDIGIDDLAKVWRAPTAKLLFEIDFAPTEDPSRLDLAICRLMGHAEPASGLSSPHAEAWFQLFERVHERAGDRIRPPELRPGMVAPDRSREFAPSDRLAERLDTAMDFGLLSLLDSRIADISGNPMLSPIRIEPALLNEALAKWPEWHSAASDMSTTDRLWVFRLLGGLLDDFGRPDIWNNVRVGPKCVEDELLPAVILHLIMQALLGDFGSPKMLDMGNVERLPSGCSTPAAHFCGTRWARDGSGKAIEIDTWDPKWPGPQWQPSCMVLPGRRSDPLPDRTITRLREATGMVDRPSATVPIIYRSRELQIALRTGRAETLRVIKGAFHRALPEILTT